MTVGYCVRCKASKEMKSPKAITMKNGKPAQTGTCPTCGTKIFRIGKQTPGAVPFELNGIKSDRR